MDSPIQVAVGIIENTRGEVFLTQRPASSPLGGLWEFPGGKLQSGETPYDALVRELYEEVGIRVLNARPFIGIEYQYPDECMDARSKSPSRHRAMQGAIAEHQVYLDVWRIVSYTGEPYGREGQPFQWCPPHLLNTLALPAANQPILQALQLPEQYLITPEPQPPYDDFLKALCARIDSGLHLVQLRAHSLAAQDYKALARELLEHTRTTQARIFLNTDWDTVMELDSPGWHLTAARLASPLPKDLPASLWICASCHSLADLKRAEELKLNFAQLSPVKLTQSHPGTPALGWSRFSEWVRLAQIPVYALGGLSVADLPDAFSHGAQGIAGISALWS